jgi:hypothetical protein
MIDAIRTFVARCEARAMLFTTGEYENCGEAVTPLLVIAHESGLTGTLDPDTVAAIINDLFRKYGSIHDAVVVVPLALDDYSETVAHAAPDA